MGISRARPNFESFLSIIHKKGAVMKRLNSAFYLIIPGGPIIVIPAFSVQEVMKEQDICLNCKYFHQKEDWRDTPGEIYMPMQQARQGRISQASRRKPLLQIQEGERGCQHPEVRKVIHPA